MEPFTIAVPDAVLDDLHERLGRTRLPNQLPDIGWEQGTERNYFVELHSYWHQSYDWRTIESRLNSYPQHLTHIDGTRIHLLHARSAKPDAIPLLITHGWPGSIIEFLDVIELLKDDFHIVAPSLPGFTFSGETSQRGWHPRRIAAAWADLMSQLGYERYGLQGGDWGSLVSANLADLHPDRIIGLHLNMVTAVHPVPEATLTKEEELEVDAARRWRRSRFGLPGDSGNSAADSRLRPRGLARWRRCLDCREGSRVERWRRDSFLSRPDSRQHHRLLGHRNRDVLIANLLGDASSSSGGHSREPDHRTNSGRDVSGRDQLPTQGLDTGRVQRCALDNTCSGWSLRRVGSADRVLGRRQGVLLGSEALRRPWGLSSPIKGHGQRDFAGSVLHRPA